MSNNLKCNSCGSTDIDVDPSRADAVCTNCGNVLESSIIVSDIQFEENAHGGSSAIGTFVSSDSKGGGTFSGYGGGGSGRGLGNFQSGIIRESREITLKNARKKIEALAQQLSLRRDRIDMAFHIFKLALGKHLTRGRRSTHVIAACVYITCRTESTPHMLIDFSDILQIDVYELGRTYLRLSQALCINIPAMDPCLYVMRFAHHLELGEKTHEVSMTALRLVSRMKKDWIHFGRRPSGLCGAALLIAARMHGYNRSVGEVIKVVKVHESTLRKRLNEFGETPASQLTLDEFMNIDLDAMTEEQDPPSFKAARKRDKERLANLEEDEDIDKELTELETKIETALDDMRAKVHKRGPLAKLFREAAEAKRQAGCSGTSELDQTHDFIAEETLGAIKAAMGEEARGERELDRVLMPPPSAEAGSRCQPKQLGPGLGLRDSIQDYLVSNGRLDDNNRSEGVGDEDSEELDLTGIDDTEIDGYIMTDREIEFKTSMWMRVNAEYLKEQEEKAERERREAEEGGEAKKKPRKSRKKPNKAAGDGSGHHQTAIEAIEKIVAEKKISTKINYDVLRSLSSSSAAAGPGSGVAEASAPSGIFGQSSADVNKVFAPSLHQPPKRLASFRKREDRDLGLKRPAKPELSPTKPAKAESALSPTKRPRIASEAESDDNVVVESGPVLHDADYEEEEDEEDYNDDDKMLSAGELLSQHTGETFGEDFEEEEYY